MYGQIPIFLLLIGLPTKFPHPYLPYTRLCILSHFPSPWYTRFSIVNDYMDSIFFSFLFCFVFFSPFFSSPLSYPQLCFHLLFEFRDILVFFHHFKFNPKLGVLRGVLWIPKKHVLVYYQHTF